jgi:transposase InsO family protein
MAGRAESAICVKTVAGLLADLKISRSHSRPRVSNDNPYSEAQFKTLAAFNIGRLQQDSGR